jgi:hypothetical protein
MSDRFLEQQTNIKFCVKPGKNNASETLKMLSGAYGGEAIKKANVMSVINGSKKPLMSKSQTKKMLIKFLDIRGTVHFEFILQGQKINEAYYMEILQRLYEAVPIKGPEIWPNDWILHHDNAPAYKVLSLIQFLAQKSITETEHPSCSPDLAPNDFWLFPKIKSALNGRRFQDIKRTQKNITTALKAIPQHEFQKYFQQWQRHWAKCIAAQGEFFEGGPSQ